MSQDSKTYLYLAVMAVLSWLLVNLAGVENVGHGFQAPHSPDYFSTGYAKWVLDENGALKNKLLAEKMTHYSDDRTTHLDQPEYQSYSGQPQNQQNATSPWVVVAESGLLSADGKELQLQGKVSIARAAAQGVKPLQINTTDLKVNPDTRQAETKAQAELLSYPNRTTGTGMKLTFVEPVRLELLGHVQGKYETK